jgi:pyruvate dehydrogenase E2 component (dihydrolipoamide acetyltransferase)
MAEKIVMLALSPTMETGTIAKWNIKEGDSFSSGDVICEVETDKATMDYESPTDGTLLKIVAKQGTKVKVGETIAISGEKGEDISEFIKEVSGGEVTPVKKEIKAAVPPSHPKETPKTHVPAQQPSGKPVKRAAPSQPEKFPQGVKASPLAREIAKEKGIDIGLVQGSGPGGRIIKEDVEHAGEEKRKATFGYKPEAVEAYERIKVTEKRKIIAQRLSESKFTAPHFYITISVEMDALLNARQKLNKTAKEKVSLNAFLMKFTAEALRRHPIINSTWEGDTVLIYKSIDIALAVAQKDGLVTPVVRGCGSKGILKIDGEIRDLVVRARDGKLMPEEYTNGTFTISNLGSYGIRQFTAIINPPQSAILAVGEIFKEQVVGDDDLPKIRKTCLMTFSFDHRVIDGATGAEFCRDFKNMIENPIIVLYS